MNSGALIHHDGRVVGAVREGTFYRTVMGSKHMFRRSPGPGWSISKAVVEDLEARGDVHTINVRDLETSVEYVVPFRRFVMMGKPIDFGDLQVCLHQRFWNYRHIPEDDHTDAVKDLI